MERLEAELPQEDILTWLKPLQTQVHGHTLQLFAPNDFVREAVRERYLARIRELAQHFGNIQSVQLVVGTASAASASATAHPATAPDDARPQAVNGHEADTHVLAGNLDGYYQFDNFVQGRSNAMAKAAAMKAAQSPGKRENNPVLLYGGTGLGKTHLMLAAGNLIRQNNPKARVLYLRSDEFFNAFFRALQERRTDPNAMDKFKRTFQKLDALLIDDVQFFVGKGATQEEFFHTFNTLFDSKQQIILTCDRYPREVEGLEPRLRSRMSTGLAVGIEPPDFETRAQIVLAKARERGAEVPEEVVMMLAKRMQSNVRELEGALNSLVARANLMGESITREFAFETLRDLFRAQQSVVSIQNIQKVVADYYALKPGDLVSKSRTNSITRPRHMAMYLARELTDHSLPEIGEAFGGRDHTTVMNGCRKIKSLIDSDAKLHSDLEKLMRKLTE